MKILIVEDDIETWFLLNSLLKRYKVTTRFVHTPASARQCLQEDIYNLLFLNHRLDGAGSELARYVSTTHGKTKIILLLDGQKPDSEMSHYCLQRPFNRAAVDAVMQQAAAGTGGM